MSDTTRKDAVDCPTCKTAMEEVARIEPLQKVQGSSHMPALPADTRRAKYCRRAGVGINMPLKLRPTALGSTEKPGRQVYLA